MTRTTRVASLVLRWSSIFHVVFTGSSQCRSMDPRMDLGCGSRTTRCCCWRRSWNSSSIRLTCRSFRRADGTR